MHLRSLFTLSVLLAAAACTKPEASAADAGTPATGHAEIAVLSPSATDAGAVAADAGTTRAVKGSLKTTGGALEIVEDEANVAYELRLGGRRVLSSKSREDAPIPSFVKSFGEVAPFDEVVLVRWDGMGNACNGYGYTMLGIDGDGAYVSNDLPFCGGPEPVFTPTKGALPIPDAIGISIPAHAPTRGGGMIAAESYEYRDGAIRSIKKSPVDLAPTWATGEAPVKLVLRVTPRALSPMRPFYATDVLLGNAGTPKTTELGFQSGGFDPSTQPACGGATYPLAKGELAKLAFYEGGATGVAVKRSGDRLEVGIWSQGDGACDGKDGPTSCPASWTPVAFATLPKGAKLETSIELHDGSKHVALSCDGGAPHVAAPALARTKHAAPAGSSKPLPKK